MNKESISFKLKASALFLVSLLFLLIIYSGFLIHKKNSLYPTANRGRLLTNSAKEDIEKAIKENSQNESIVSKYKYAAANLDGKIIYSSINEYKKDTYVNILDFNSFDERFSNSHKKIIRYSEPLVINKRQVGTVIFLIPEKDFLPSSPFILTMKDMFPILFLIITIALTVIIICYKIKRNILVPISFLNESSIRILKGDFSYKIKYDYDTEIGVFCHNFEAMRDELKFSKEKEEAIKISEKELLACISHDMKTPLTAICGYVSGIKDGIVKDSEGILNYCNIILKRIKMLSKLLDDILEHSKAELNKLNISLDEFYSKDFFHNIIEDLKIELESKGFKFTEPKYIPDLLINADKKRITEVIYNLISNSIKYSKDNKEICMYFENSEDYLKVFIKDNGIGITSSDIPYIFNKFYRGEKSRNQNIGGSGLGLSICKYIVEAHGGFIKCIESSRNGTTMCFSLPLK